MIVICRWCLTSLKTLSLTDDNIFIVINYYHRFLHILLYYYHETMAQDILY